jgi:hypothetical protein
MPVSTRADDTTVRIIVTARALLSAGPRHITLTARQGPAPETWQYTLNDGTDHRAAHGRIASKASHIDLRDLRRLRCHAQPSWTPRQPPDALGPHWAAD